jgi:hypothetical protein
MTETVTERSLGKQVNADIQGFMDRKAFAAYICENLRPNPILFPVTNESG